MIVKAKCAMKYEYWNISGTVQIEFDMSTWEGGERLVRALTKAIGLRKIRKSEGPDAVARQLTWGEMPVRVYQSDFGYMEIEFEYNDILTESILVFLERHQG